jgi:hypothetical protein
MPLVGRGIAKDACDGRILSFVYTAVGDGLNTVEGKISTIPPQSKHLFSKPRHVSPLHILWCVKDITLEFAQRIMAAADRLNATLMKKIAAFLSHHWEGQTYRWYEYDIRGSLSALLRPHSAVIIPKTKLAERFIRQPVADYRLGSYFKPSENESCFWRAFLPCTSEHPHIATL